MKIQHIVPLLLLAGSITVGAQTTNTTPHTKTMSYTLTFVLEDNQKKIPNPTDSDIQAAMHTKVSDDVGGIFYISVDEPYEALQLEANGKGHFGFTYEPNADPNGKGILFSRRDNLNLEEALKVLLAYRNGSADWKKLLEWKH